MKHLTSLPHRRAHGLCPVNGIRDLVHWRTGRDWSNELLWGLGQGGGFAYLRFKAADPPRQVYWGVAGPRQHRYLAELFGAPCTEIENRSFDFSWNKAREAVDAGTPPVLGPLDMYYLHFYEDMYQKRHVPIHYELLVGYEDDKAFVQDTDQDEVQEIPLEELRSAWNVNVPGLGKRNRLTVLDIPQELAPTDALLRKAVADQCQTMLRPPVSMVGVPAMKKVAREMPGWRKELGNDAATRSLLQIREYLSSPPDLEGDHLTAGRDLYVRFLEEAGSMAGMDFTEAIDRLRQSISVIPDLAEALRQNRLEDAASHFERIAEAETRAYSHLSETVGASS